MENNTFTFLYLMCMPWFSQEWSRNCWVFDWVIISYEIQRQILSIHFQISLKQKCLLADNKEFLRFLKALSPKKQPCGNNSIKQWTHNQKVRSPMEAQLTDFDWLVTVHLAIFEWHYLLDHDLFTLHSYLVLAKTHFFIISEQDFFCIS